MGTINVEQLLTSIRQSANTTKTSCLGNFLEAGDVERLIKECYKYQVQERGRKYEFSEKLNRSLGQLATLLVDDESYKFGIMLCGNCGNGKTTFLFALQRLMEVLSRAKLFTGIDQYGYHCNYIRNLRIVDAREVNELARDTDAFLRLKRERYLAIDDVGREEKQINHFGSVFKPIMELFEYRYDNQLPTIITTNLSPLKLHKQYDERIADRMQEMFSVVVFEDKSFRK